ncbi:MAG: serine hydrolase domain-containing protein [Candidatus Hodarchaeales archaeon]|jgi:CubicO group peptidase (beta-lactamase class C family)
MKRQNVTILLLPLFILVFLSAAFFFLASEPSSDNEPNSNAPNGPDGSEFNDWKTSTPEQQGLSSVQLALMEEYMEDWNLDFHSVLVIRNGYLVFEKYYDNYDADTLHELYSCTKTVVSALVGIAIHEGYISSVEERVLDFFPERIIANNDSRKWNMTIEHLLTMTTGLDWPELAISYDDPNNVYHLWTQSPDWVQFVLDRPMVLTPGTKFNYNSGASHLLSAILQKATGMSTSSFAYKHLFTPLDISTLIWPSDPQGVNTGGSRLQMRPRDMAKIGYMYLQNGTWNGTQIVPAEWVERSTRKHYPVMGSLYVGYGYQWWNYYSNSSDYPIIDAYSAVGYAGQRIFVVPDQNLVVVFTGYVFYNTGVLGIKSNVYVHLVTTFVIPDVGVHWRLGKIRTMP